jgi:hypothetical protein
MNSVTVTAVCVHLDIVLFQAAVCLFLCVYKLGMVILSQEGRDEFVTMLLDGRQVGRMYKDTLFSP